jgi:hypothetical protein
VDPFNKNSSVSKKVDSVVYGGRFSVTLRNPTNNPVAYSINGERQISLLPGYRITHSGVGKCDITFDIGRGDGTIRAYNLPSGKTFHFVRRYQSEVGATPGGNFLDLVKEQ